MDFFPWILLSLCAGITIAQGGSNVGSEAFFAFIVGLILVLRPPTHGLGRTGNFCLLMLGLLPVLALLPGCILPCGDWRLGALNHGIALPWTLPPNLWNLMEHWVGSSALIGFAYIAFSENWEHDVRSKILQAGSLFAIILASIALVADFKGLKNPLIPEARVFSYFPSRNQTGTFFMAWGIICFGLTMNSQLHKRWKRMTWQLMGSMILLLATIQTHSRAAAALTLVGYMGVGFLAHKNWQKKDIFRLGLPLLLIASSLFILGGGDWARVIQLFSSGDFRFSLYKDVLVLIQDHWLSGTGLANFYSVIPFYREIGTVSQQTLHPESDLLWIFSEIGIFGGFLALVLWCTAFKNTLPWRSESALSLRTVVALALTAYSVHSVIDVPMHFLASAMMGIFLYPLSVKVEFIALPDWTLKLWKILGLFLMGIGAFWGMGALMDWPTHSALVKAKHNAIIEELSIAPQISDDWENVFTEALEDRPMDWWLYTQRAGIHLNFERNFTEAAQDFDRALFVEPVSATVAFSIGVMWLNWDLEKTYEAWDKALDRASADPAWLCEDMLRRSVDKKTFLPYLNRLSEKSAIFKEKFLQHLHTTDFLLYLRQYLKTDPLLKAISKASAEAFWIEYAELAPDEFLSYQLQNPPLENFWQGTLMAYFSQKLWEKGATLALEKATPPPPLPPPGGRSILETERAFRIDPTDSWAGMQLVKSQMEKGDWQAAHATLQKLLLQKPIFPYVSYSEAVVEMKLKDFEKSANAWKQYLQKP